MTISDQLQRQTAIDPTRSFIVQAPAGSGKTELLIQRYLALLARVQSAPEEIIAITFTRKAAAEMQERIMHALRSAQANQLPESEHTQKTRELAQAVLQRDQQEQWHLLENQQRLRVLTIDALCLSLVQQMPILSHIGSTPQIAEDANALYTEAVRSIIAGLEDQENWNLALEQLLMHLDNQHHKVESLLIDMLARRDQWLPHLVSTNINHLIDALERSLQNIVLENIEKLHNSISDEIANELIIISQYAANNLDSITSNSPIVACSNLTSLPRIDLNDLPQWIGFAHLLLTKEHDWRKRLTENEGFPAPSKMKDKQQKQHCENNKKRMQQLLLQLQDNETLKQLFSDILSSPPTNYSHSQRSIIESLVTLLPILVAQLRLIFAQKGKVDYCEITLCALQALGETETPTDLALSLDYRIQHILIDEFQDTSHSQYHLIEKLTAEWQTKEGRTLFLVGDPMQSIYRFRKAEVGLFLLAKKEGIGNIQLAPLTLSANFRSDPLLVKWNNFTFSRVFPKYNDMSCGAIQFNQSYAVRNTINNAAVKIHAIDKNLKQREGKIIVDIISHSRQNNPDASIAILVRSRLHLLNIINTLQKNKITYQAVEIELLTQKSVIQDLLALTKALLHLADRTAWLAILRAPWLGLTLADLHALTFNNTENTIWELLAINHHKINTAYQKQLNHFITVINNAFKQRRLKPLRYWIEGVWLALGGPACLSDESDLENAQTFFKLLDNMSIGNDISDLNQLEKQLNLLTATPLQLEKPYIEIMTIHKAKGLEFDTVIIAGLDRQVRSDDNQLLLWMERTGEHGVDDLILAPIKATAQEQDPIYNYVRREEQKKSFFESQRLLYVATTRAKQQLHLVFHYEQDENNNGNMKAPHTQSLLSQLWPYFSDEDIIKIHDNNVQEDDVININDQTNLIPERPLKRLKKFKLL